MTSRPLHRPGDTEPRGQWPPPSADAGVPPVEAPAGGTPTWVEVAAAAAALVVIVAVAVAFTVAAVWQVVG